MDGVVGCPKLTKARRHISLRFIMNESFPRVFWVCKQCAGERSRHRREECEEPGTPASAGDAGSKQRRRRCASACGSAENRLGARSVQPDCGVGKHRPHHSGIEIDIIVASTLPAP